MKRLVVALIGALVLGLGASAAEAKLKVFACFPEWNSLAKALGGDRLDIFLASSPLENPDYVQPTPGLIAAMHDADLVICTGNNFEEDWLPKVEERVNNPKVAVGQPGMFFASDYSQVLNVGENAEVGGTHHLHEEGNPHVQGDPRNVLRIAAQLTKRLIALDPEGEATYTANFKDFAGKLKALEATLEAKAAPLRGVRIVVQHEHSVYVLAWLGIVAAAVIEPEPGVPAGPDYVTKVVQTAVANGAKFVVYAGYEDPSSSKYVAKQAGGLPTIKVPFTVGGTPEAKDLFSFYEDTVNRLLDGLAGKERS